MGGLGTFLITPFGNFVGVLLIGIVAGWIWERFSSSSRGYATSELVGIAGGYLGFSLVSFSIAGLGLQVTHVTPARLAGAVVGAVIILWVWRTVKLP